MTSNAPVRFSLSVIYHSLRDLSFFKSRIYGYQFIFFFFLLLK